jgi:hypothetical protein
MKSKFHTKKKTKLEDIKHFFLFWKGRSKGMIYTRILGGMTCVLYSFPMGLKKSMVT